MTRAPVMKLLSSRARKTAAVAIGWHRGASARRAPSSARANAEALEHCSRREAVKATVQTERLENINNVFERMRAGQIEGRVVLDFGNCVGERVRSRESERAG
jgi:hypothetical protein